MVNTHICAESCFDARHADKSTIKCFLCDKALNAKCFGINAKPTVNLLSSGGNVVFLCYRCMDRISKVKQNPRRSVDTNKSGTSANVNETNPNQRTANDSGEGVMMDNMMTILKQINDNFMNFTAKNVDLEVKNMNQKLTEIHAKMDQQHVSRTTAENKTGTAIIQSLNDIQEKITTRTDQTSHIAVASKCQNPLNKNGNKRAVITDPLNWSFSFSPATIPSGSNELYQLLNGFEQNTWTSLDYLRHKLDDNTDMVTNIQSNCKEIKNLISHHRLESPLTETIELENLHRIQDKCDLIEKNVRILETTVNKIAERNVPMQMNIATTGTPHDPLTVSQPDENAFVKNSVSTQQIQQQTVAGPTASGQENQEQEIYVAKFPISTTCENIREYIAHRIRAEVSSLKVIRLTKKNQDISHLSFVSFKIETNSELAGKILQPDFWPNQVYAKEWKRKGQKLFDLNLNMNHFLSGMGSDNHKL